jgi:hypothetical protein
MAKKATKKKTGAKKARKAIKAGGGKGSQGAGKGKGGTKAGGGK